MICNKTNAGRIAFMYGDDTDGWIGREIVLTSEFVEYQGKTVKGLRVKPPPQKPSVAAGSNGNSNYELRETGQFSTGGPRTKPPLDEAHGDSIEEAQF